MDVIKSFVKIASRKERRDQYNASRDRSRAWQATREEGNYPAAYSLSYLEGELPPVVETPVMSTKQRRALFNDPYEVIPPRQPPAQTARRPPKDWSFKEFVVVYPNSNLIIGGTSAEAPQHHIKQL